MNRPLLQNERNDAIIQVENLKAAFNGKTVFQNVSFNVYRGEVMVIAGPSGCGKSTLMKQMIGLYRPDEGRVVIDGDELLHHNSRSRHRILRKFGVMYQQGALFGAMTLLENVRLPLEEFTDLNQDIIDMIALTKLKMVDLEHAASKLPAELSGGMQKRAAIARAVALDPDIVFLDEPSAGLDPVTAAGLDELIKRFSRMLKMTFVVISHELASIFNIAHRVAMLDSRTRTLIALDPPQQLRDHNDHPRIRAFFRHQPDTEHTTTPAE